MKKVEAYLSSDTKFVSLNPVEVERYELNQLRLEKTLTFVNKYYPGNEKVAVRDFLVADGVLPALLEIVRETQYVEKAERIKDDY